MMESTMKNFAEFQILGRVGKIKEFDGKVNVTVCANYPTKKDSETRENPHWNEVSIFSEAVRDYASKYACAPKARVTCGGRFHPDSCRLVWKLTSGSVGQLAGLEPRDKGRLGRLSDPAGRNVSEV